jgi:hypothetical protein
MKTKSSLNPVSPSTEALPGIPVGEFVCLEGEKYYRISAYDRLDPFLMSVPSDTDLWMFVTSGGGLTAGRVDADGSLFPYRTVDQLHDAHHHTGPLSSIQLEKASGECVRWDPFAEDGAENPRIERNLYKNTIGNRLVFEEINHELGLAFRYRWSACDEFGWVRTATLENRSPLVARMTLLDGLRNILPYGAPLSLYQQSSNLVDAYKKSEVDPETGLGIYSLTAQITDRAEALEMLKANTVWCCGLERFKVHLSLDAVKCFHARKLLTEDRVTNGIRGNYLVSCAVELQPKESARWHIVGDTGRDQVQIASLRRRLLEEDDLSGLIEERLHLAGESLRRNVASADGLQLSEREETWVHHFTNVLFNNMRGGVFLYNYTLPMPDFRDFLRVHDPAVLQRRRAELDRLPEICEVDQVHAAAQQSGDPDLQRLSYEYLPLYFGRRHGDPSRPWNGFSIRTRNEAGEERLNFEGNWRDIFQNWEALGTAFPGFLANMVAKFVNASTVDGFNPYRITRDGVDWETVLPDDPWSNIGYWGDHQIIYLLKLLESLDRHEPAALDELLEREIFSYAEVPYRIKPYEEILRNPRLTIDFDHVRARSTEERVQRAGTDGKLLHDSDGSVYHANLFEKLLVPALSKLSNLVLDAGIWMNTQRPEWNDANNALGGGGVSVVTLCHLRRYLAFLAGRLEASPTKEYPVSREVADWLNSIESILDQERDLLTREHPGGRDRKRMMDALGEAFSVYRQGVYAHGFSGKTSVAVRRVVELCTTALEFIDHGLSANRRQDGLFHTYNLLDFAKEEASAEVKRLPAMLEGQVAILSSGFLLPQEALEVLERLFASALYQPTQRSFLLYPEREVPGFMAKNVVPRERAEEIPLLRELLAQEDHSVLGEDAEGVLRFCGEFKNALDVSAALDALKEREEWASAVQRDRPATLELFEGVFQHESYTGRSGVMFGYEGLGCIYWHMIAKLLLAVQETIFRAFDDDAPQVVREALSAMYFRVRDGLGYQRSVAEFGAFPTDPYSHTPAAGGAKQPGMTGQVKEEILTRQGELGVRVEHGRVRVRPLLLRSEEFLAQPEVFHYFDVSGTARSIALSTDSLAFTFCQVPVIVQCAAANPKIVVAFEDGSSSPVPGDTLSAELSAELFSRSGRIERISVEIPDHELSPHERR